MSTLFASGCVIPFGTARIELEGTVLDSETEEPLTGPTVVVRAMSSMDGSEWGRGAASVVDGEFFAIIPTLAETTTRILELTVDRDGCETVFILDMDEDVTFVDLPFPRSFIFRITEPILVPPCESEGDSAP